METLIQITGVQYTCAEADLRSVMTGMQQQKPEVLLVTEQTHDFGIIVRALVGTEYRGVVSRFDLKSVLRMMQCGKTSVIVGKVEDTDSDGGCYNIRVCENYPTDDDSPEALPDIWADWHWTGAPLMDNSPEDCRLDISLKVVLTELQRSGSMNKQTLLEHLALIMELARWDVSRETQQQLSLTRRLVSRHTDPDIRSLTPRLCRTLTAMGSRKRTRLFQEQYLPMLCESKAAKRMYRQWCTIHKSELCDVKLWEATVRRQLDAIEECLTLLPADLCYQKDQFGALMHRLLYLNVPRQKLLMLLSAFVLRRQLRKQLGLDEEESGHADEEERRLALQLAPIFHGDTESVREFLLLTRDQKPTDITHIVNLWVREKRISSTHCRRPLWTVLHEAGIYKPTESNWNTQIIVRRNGG